MWTVAGQHRVVMLGLWLMMRMLMLLLLMMMVMMLLMMNRLMVRGKMQLSVMLLLKRMQGIVLIEYWTAYVIV